MNHDLLPGRAAGPCRAAARPPARAGRSRSVRRRAASQRTGLASNRPRVRCVQMRSGLVAYRRTRIRGPGGRESPSQSGPGVSPAPPPIQFKLPVRGSAGRAGPGRFASASPAKLRLDRDPSRAHASCEPRSSSEKWPGADRSSNRGRLRSPEQHTPLRRGPLSRRG